MSIQRTPYPLCSDFVSDEIQATIPKELPSIDIAEGKRTETY